MVVVLCFPCLSLAILNVLSHLNTFLLIAEHIHVFFIFRFHIRKKNRFSQSLFPLCCGNSNFNQHIPVHFTKHMNSDFFDICTFRMTLYQVRKFCNRRIKYLYLWIFTLQYIEVVFYIIYKKLWYINHSVTTYCFRPCKKCSSILHICRFIDTYNSLIQIKIFQKQSYKFCFCQYKSKKNLLLIRKKHHCFHPVMLLRTILFRLCFFFFVENVIHLPAYLHTTWFINKDFLNNL